MWRVYEIDACSFLAPLWGKRKSWIMLLLFSLLVDAGCSWRGDPRLVGSFVPDTAATVECLLAMNYCGPKGIEWIRSGCDRTIVTWRGSEAVTISPEASVTSRYAAVESSSESVTLVTEVDIGGLCRVTNHIEFISDGYWSSVYLPVSGVNTHKVFRAKWVRISTAEAKEKIQNWVEKTGIKGAEDSREDTVITPVTNKTDAASK